MKMKQRSKKTVAWGLIAAMCLSLFIASGLPAVIKAEEEVTLSNPVIEAEKGHVVWDCVYFGNYWQKEYIPQSGDRPQNGEADVEHTDKDGTKYIVRENARCYKYEPIKWRVLSVSEDGTDAFLMADKCLDAKVFDSREYTDDFKRDDVTWENCALRTWLKETFMSKAFSEEEQGAIKITEVDNKSYSSYYNGNEIEDGATTQDQIYLPSLDDMVNKKYGFINNFNPTNDPTERGFSETETRKAPYTDFASVFANAPDRYLLRTLGAFKGYVLSTDCGMVSVRCFTWI